MTFVQYVVDHSRIIGWTLPVMLFVGERDLNIKPKMLRSHLLWLKLGGLQR